MDQNIFLLQNKKKKCSFKSLDDEKLADAFCHEENTHFVALTKDNIQTAWLLKFLFLFYDFCRVE